MCVSFIHSYPRRLLVLTIFGFWGKVASFSYHHGMWWSTLTSQLLEISRVSKAFFQVTYGYYLYMNSQPCHWICLTSVFLFFRHNHGTIPPMYVEFIKCSRSASDSCGTCNDWMSYKTDKRSTCMRNVLVGSLMMYGLSNYTCPTM